MAKKEMKTMAYGSSALRLQTKQGILFNTGVELIAVLDTETGEVTFKISDEDLQKVREQEKK
ncbi:hypothetical protein ERX37_06270 [Macrococcus hajekii]|uniref:Uncharacterized protein n=1 Tax=Macrococcus hajekii TaxID=198482 RepID=A0A4R6BJK5_9STAP|nr:hypothetical protein [Macrococcus hajekii]TDM01810.1 hypothetical protein ERX37_06270 [Macrococcus hajekii]GGB07650.1 hypothetical protein GCM10007190_14550 [Macrococcus hajekii]